MSCLTDIIKNVSVSIVSILVLTYVVKNIETPSLIQLKIEEKINERLKQVSFPSPTTKVK